VQTVQLRLFPVVIGRDSDESRSVFLLRYGAVGLAVVGEVSDAEKKAVLPPPPQRQSTRTTTKPAKLQDAAPVAAVEAITNTKNQLKEAAKQVKFESAIIEEGGDECCNTVKKCLREPKLSWATTSSLRISRLLDHSCNYGTHEDMFHRANQAYWAALLAPGRRSSSVCVWSRMFRSCIAIHDHHDHFLCLCCVFLSRLTQYCPHYSIAGLSATESWNKNHSDHPPGQAL
jgi:hypothetical protein